MDGTWNEQEECVNNEHGEYQYREEDCICQQQRCWKYIIPANHQEQFILLVLEVFCEIEADQESNSPTGGGLRTWFVGVVFDTVDESSGRLRPCGRTRTIRAFSKAHYRSESVKFHWLLDFSSLGIVLVDILEESNTATELLRFLGHMNRCFRGARSIFGSSSFCIRDRTRCHYWRRATS
ncbi:hypothetical protein YC2023_085549 [Brassica napus]